MEVRPTTPALSKPPSRNNEMQPIHTCEEKGVLIRLQVPESNPEALSRQIVKSDKATVKIPELDFEIPPGTQRSCVTTVEGLLQ